MPKFLNFFPRQVLMGDSGASLTLYSDVFSAADISQVYTSAKVYAHTGATSAITGTIEHNDDPAFNDAWATYQTLAVTGVNAASGTVTSAPRKFVRAKLVIPAGEFYTIHFQTRGFC